jgi:hypothetical protein
LEAPVITSATPGPGSAEISWTEPTQPDGVGVVTYQVYRDGAAVDGATGSPATVSGLTAGQSYSFTVVASTSDGVQTVSEASSATPTDANPAAPTIGTTTVTGGNQLIVNWTNGAQGASPISGYTVQASDDGGPMTTVSGACAALSAAATSCAVTGLTTAIRTRFRWRPLMALAPADAQEYPLVLLR